MAEWISVKDRLPESEEERVLVRIKYKELIYGVPSLDTDRYKNNNWVRYGEYVTHWMPLPEPPKGK